MLADAEWAVLAPMIGVCRQHHKIQHPDLRPTNEAIIWRHQNEAKWRSIPMELGPFQVS